MNKWPTNLAVLVTDFSVTILETDLPGKVKALILFIQPRFHIRQDTDIHKRLLLMFSIFAIEKMTLKMSVGMVNI